MEDTIKKQEHKRVRYNVLFMPDDDTMTEKRLSVKMDVFIAFFAAIAFLLIAAFTYSFILIGELGDANKTIIQQKIQIEEITEEYNQAVAYNAELQEKVTILSDTVKDKVQKEEEREAQQLRSCMPSGFPLKGTASYSESENELDGQPIAYFQVAPGTGVVATANGKVSSIAGNSGSGYIIMVDHGNGYYSVYRNGSKPKVDEGDEVTRATELFVIEIGHGQLGYQIIENNQYINPLEFMETYG